MNAESDKTRDDQVAAIKKMETAKRNLAEAKASYDGPTIEEAEEKVVLAAKSLEAATEHVAKLRASVKLAEDEESRLTNALEITAEKQISARRHEEAMAGWAETIKQAVLDARDGQDGPGRAPPA